MNLNVLLGCEIIARNALDLAVTPTNIKSGFRATGIFSYHPNIFTDSDYIQATASGENADEIPLEEKLNILFTETPPDVSAEAEVSTSEEPSTSASVSRASSLSSLLTDIGPL